MHTQSVAKGNGRDEFLCWIFSKCDTGIFLNVEICEGGGCIINNDSNDFTRFFWGDFQIFKTKIKKYLNLMVCSFVGSFVLK